MEFAKLHGTGNDFVVIDARALDRDWADVACRICDRHFGVGADGLILATASKVAPVRMRIFNADGSEAEMSGNGLRCLVKFVVDRRIVAPDASGECDVETGAGVLRVRTETDATGVRSVRESMGRPRLDARDIPIAIEAEAPVRRVDLQANGRALAITPVSMGNPHAVHFQQSPVAEFPLEALGPLVEHHALFPNRANFEVIRMLDRSTAEMRVWERGVGETLSCGSGASATMVAARILGLADDRLELRVPGGVLQLEWDGEGEVILSGPVEEVFVGTWLE